MPTLEELTIEGWRLSPYGPGLDPAVFNTFTVVAPTPDAGLEEAFFQGGFVPQPEVLQPRAPAPPPAPPAPPRAAPLPEVVVTAGRAAAPVLGGLGAMLLPSPIAPEPDVRGLAPVFPQPLAEVTITGQRPPPAPPPALVASPATPSGTPNWLQPLGWQQYLRFGLESAGRFAANVLRRELIGDITDAMLDALRGEPAKPDGRAADARRTDDVSGDRRSAPAPQLDTVTVTARRPGAAPAWGTFAPGLLADPLDGLRLDPFGVPALDPVASPRAQPEPVTRVVDRAAPLVGTPTDTGIVTWLTPLIGDPIATPRDTPTRTPAPPKLTPDPIDIFDPIISLDPFGDPPTAPPTDKTDQCNCPKPKKRKPRTPRSVCRSGTYTQSKTGISYSPKRTFQCP